MSDFEIERRRLIQLASASLFTSHFRLAAQACSNANHESAVAHAKPYSPRFFTPEELKLLDQAMEAILPADEHSPGAHEAQAALYADLVVSSSPRGVKQNWRAGLRLLAAELKDSSLAEWLNRASGNEHDPRSVLDVFFVNLKQTTVEGYYTSQIGIHQELGYVGNTYVKEFKGCTHEEHRTQTGGGLRGGILDRPAASMGRE